MEKRSKEDMMYEDEVEYDPNTLLKERLGKY